jgi:sugar O-acyltransferase (sialic acid O-acetyltransferase NeuD family)
MHRQLAGWLGNVKSRRTKAARTDVWIVQAIATDEVFVRIAILGAGGHGKVVADAAMAMDGVTVVGFLDDNPALAGKTIMGLPVLGDVATLQELFIDAVVAAVGDNQRRREVFISARTCNAVLANVVHPTAVVSRRANMGIGTAVLAGAIINADANLGENVIINTGAIVEHDCAIEAHVHIAPGCCLAGGVRVGEGSLLGIGCRILPGLNIGRWCTVGAGAVVVEDVADHATVAGVPARVLR